MLVVKNSYQQKLLKQVGYFIDEFLNDEEVQFCKQIFQSNFANHQDVFYSSSFHQDFSLKKKVSDQILAKLSTKIEARFSDFKLLGVSFLEKKANQNNPLPIHQDWTVTDEEKFGSFTIWIPLDDTTKNNGALRVIDGSHQIENNFRAPSLPVAFDKHRANFEKYLKTLAIPNGNAFVFNQKLMHASWSNSSNENRLALTIGLVPKDADLFMLYYDAAKKQINKYEMPDDLFLHYPEIIKAPTIGKLIESFSYQIKEFNETDLKESLYQNRIKSNTMQPLFASEKDQDDFEKNGYVLQTLLDENDIKELKDFLYNSGIKKETDFGFYVGMDHENKTLVAEMMSKISEIALPKVMHLLKDFQLITASYVIKDPNPIGVVPPHQDWTFVDDEVQHCSVTCWIPLQDVNMQNGCIGVIKGSNKFFNSVRPSPSPQVPSPLAKHMFGIFPYMQLLEMKAGEALIFDNRTFHSSPPNITNEPSLAIGLSFTQKDAQLRHYYLKPNTKDTLLKYEIDPSFFMKYDNGTLAKMYDRNEIISGFKCTEELPFIWEDLSKDEIKSRIVAAGNTYNTELAAHMAKYLAHK
ncbi:MAG: phytanoyl-CoA dioxygenase family protein [Saprospirales bacterium]|nr:phytanoyl-CoA dioxygenase family protein [Saprospirales bacterium]